MKKILKLISQIAVLILMLSLTGCYYNEVIDEVIPPNNNVSFLVDIQPILTTSCTACHPSIAPPDLTVGNSYNAIIEGNYVIPNDINASELYQRLLGNGNIMPPSGSLAASDINLIKSWIEQGALDN